MPPIGPISRRDFIKALRKLGFDGPFAGGKHPIMTRRNLTLHVPNEHEADISVGFLLRLLKQGNISRSEWENV